MCLIYRWDLNTVLGMAAKTFFAMLKAGREIEDRKRFLFMADMCDVAATPIYTPEYHTKMREYFLKMAFPESRVNKTPVLDAANPETGKLIDSIFAQKGRLEGYV